MLQSIVNSFPLIDSQNTDFITFDGINNSVITDANSVGSFSAFDLLVRQNKRIFGKEFQLLHNSHSRYSVSPIQKLLRLPAEKNLVSHSSGNFSLSISASISSSSFSSSLLSSSKPVKLSSLLLMISSCFSIFCRCSRITFSSMFNGLSEKVDKGYFHSSISRTKPLK